MCNGNALCIFDAMQTGNVDVGVNSMVFDNNNVVDREEAGQLCFWVSVLQ